MATIPSDTPLAPLKGGIVECDFNDVKSEWTYIGVIEGGKNEVLCEH